MTTTTITTTTNTGDIACASNANIVENPRHFDRDDEEEVQWRLQTGRVSRINEKQKSTTEYDLDDDDEDTPKRKMG